MQLIDNDRLTVREIHEIVPVNERFPPGSSLTRTSIAPADRFFYVDSLQSGEEDGGRPVIQQHFGSSSIKIGVGDVVLIPRAMSYTDDIYLPSVYILAYLDLNLTQTDRITKWRFAGNPEMKRRFRALLSTWAKKKTGYYVQCMREVYGILAMVERQEQASYTSPGIAAISPAVDYMREHFGDAELNIPFLASLCGMSYSHFRKRFFDVYGMSAKAYLQQLRADYARKLLQLNDFSVSEIAHRCGFSDVYYLSNFFKKVTGMSPTAYRESQLPTPTTFPRQSRK